MHRLPLVLSGVMFACLSTALPEEPEQGVQWIVSPKDAMHAVEVQQRPMLIYLTGEQCVWCRKLERSTLSDESITATIQQRFVPLKVDGAKHADLMKNLQVRGLPAMLVVAPDGSVLHRIVGYVEPDELSEALNSSLLRHKASKPRLK
ncbi:MAG: thioredoxin family protein [Planctomyces sp.]|nr:thioredoxin family protein [Planctomyces sp.]